MKKRILRTLLALAMVASLLAGCTQTPADSAPPSESQASTSAPQQQEDTPAPSPSDSQTPADADQPEAQPEETEEVQAKAEAYSLPLSDTMETLTYWQSWPPFLQGAYDPNDNPFFAEMAERLNVQLDITVVSTETVKENFNLMVVGGDLTDMIQAAVINYPGGGQKAIDDDILADMLPLINEYAPNIQEKLQNPDVRRGIVDDGGSVSQMKGMYTEPFYTDQGMWIRQDWLNKVNMEVPTTYDELHTVLSAFKTELGITDPLVVLSKGESGFLSTANGANGNIIVDGKVVDGGTTDGYRKTLEYMNMLYNEGLINQDFTSYTESQTKPPQNIVYDNAGMFNEDIASISAYVTSGQTLDADFWLAPVAVVTGEKNEKLDYGFIPQWFNTRYAISISTQCERPDLAIRYLDYLMTDDGVVLANWGTEGYTYNVDASGNKSFTDLVLNNPDLPFQLAQSVVINPGFPAVTDLSVERLSFNEAQLEAIDTWNSVFSGYGSTYPRDAATYTTEESDIVAEYLTTFETYAQESRLKFITGIEPLNDETWDTYVKTCNDLGLGKLLEVYQAAYERYMLK